MKLNKKGFTLIELLAVIVVLAIILVIAVPRILDVITTARRESIGKSAQMISKHLVQDYAIQSVTGTAPGAVTTATACPDSAKFNTTEGTCRYTSSLVSGEMIFTVTITGAGKFAGYTAVSIDGKAATVTP